jgi:Family of unknown function (DUF6069)
MSIDITTAETTAPVPAAAATGRVATPTGRVAARRRAGRAATVAASALVTAGVFAAIRSAGADFTITGPGASAKPHTFVAPEIAVVTLVFGLAGWLTLSLLERWTRRPGRTWAALAAAVTALSLVPIWIEVATGATRAGLVVVHLVVAATLMPLLRWTPARR